MAKAMPHSSATQYCEAVDMTQLEIRNFRYLSALQSDRFTIFVGASKIPFKVPKDLLAQCSPFFKKACNSPFKESTDHTINLPEDRVLTFEYFIIWLHSPEPHILPSHEIGPHTFPDPVVGSFVNLAIFAEKYQIALLKNQISDRLRTELVEGRWRLNPEFLAQIYDEVPAKSALRRLAFLGFRINLANECDKWETVFSEHADLGYDYFKHAQKGEDADDEITSGGACHFHDHSDISTWVRDNVINCLYPNGPPISMPEEPISDVDSGIRNKLRTL